MERINVMKPWLGAEEAAALAEVIESGWVAQGPRVAAFEAAFANAVQAPHAVATSNCTTALHLALVVAGIGPGDDVVVPSFSFIATSNAATYVGANPVFADVDPVTGNLTAQTIQAALTGRTRAVILPDQAGLPADLDAVRGLCAPRGITVIEDAACGAGSRYKDRPVGAGAELTAWSFHPRKILTTGEGGMLTCARPEHAERARRLREHAMSVSAARRSESVLAPTEEYGEIGFNYRMTDLQAAVGIVQLGRLEEIVRRRRELAAGYAKQLSAVPGLRPCTDPPYGRSNFQSYWVEIGTDSGTTRDALLAALAEAGISARRGIMAAHLEPAYRNRVGNSGPLPVTERLTATTLILPLYHQMTESDQARVVDVVRDSCRGA